MLQTSDLGTPPAVPPSDIAKFFRRNQTLDFSAFSTSQFACHFALSAFEAHEVLNRFCDDGLLTFLSAAEGMETWSVSRDGRHVFSERAHRLTKQQLEDIKSALLSVVSLVASAGAMEVSLGGRPVLGKPNGKLLVGVKLSHEPFTHPADELIANQIGETLTKAVPEAKCGILLFDRLVPARLKQRLVLSGNPSLQMVDTPETELDIDEVQQDARHAAYLASKGLGSEHYVSWLLAFRYRIPDSLVYSFGTERESACLPVSCRRSPVRLSKTLEEAPDSGLSDVWLKRMRKVVTAYYPHPRVFEIVAEADYSASTRQLDAYCQKLPDEDFRVLELFDHSREDLKLILLQAIQAHREVLVRERARQQEKKAHKPPADIRYYALFDTLNFKSPQLAGFVRQPASNHASLKQLYTSWELVLRQFPETPGAYLASAGFDEGVLFLDRREATAEEIFAFDLVCKSAKKTLKSLVVINGHAFSILTRYSFALSDLGPLPTALSTAQLGRPMQPRLLRGRNWRDRGRDLFPVIEQAPAAFRQVLENNIVDIENVSMDDFARHAALKPCINPVVLATGLLDDWEFSTGKNSWRAVFNAHSWGTSLESTGSKLKVCIWLDNHSHEQQLAPTSPGGVPYQGYLSSLLSFMDKVAQLKDMDVDASWETALKRTNSEDATQGRFAWLVGLIDELLNGWSLRISEFLDSDLTSWPSLCLETETDRPS